MEKWIPVEADLQLLQDWLLGFHPDTTHCQLARRTLALINWRVVSQVCCNESTTEHVKLLFSLTSSRLFPSGFFNGGTLGVFAGPLGRTDFYKLMIVIISSRKAGLPLSKVLYTCRCIGHT